MNTIFKLALGLAVGYIAYEVFTSKTSNTGSIGKEKSTSKAETTSKQFKKSDEVVDAMKNFSEVCDVNPEVSSLDEENNGTGYDEAVDVMKNFLEVWDVIPKVPFLDEWNNGTGYYDGLLEDPYRLQPNVFIGSECTSSNRKLIVIGTRLGNVVVFKRYTDSNVIAIQKCRQIEKILEDNSFDENVLSYIGTAETYKENNISKVLEMLLV